LLYTTYHFTVNKDYHNTMPAFSLRSRSPDGAATDCGDNT